MLASLQGLLCGEEDNRQRAGAVGGKAGIAGMCVGAEQVGAGVQ